MTPFSRLLARAAVAPLAVALALAAGAAPALAAEPGLEYGRDGASWSATPPAAVFPVSPELVPGGSASSVLWIRSTLDVPIDVAVAIDEVTSSSAAMMTGLQLAAATSRGADLPATPLADFTGCRAVGAPATLQPGESLRIEITAMLDPALSGRAATLASADFSLRIAAAEASAGLGEGVCGDGGIVVPGTPDPPGAGGDLASTGAPIPVGLLLLATIAWGVGWVLVSGAIRRRRASAARAASSAPSASA